MTNNKVYGMLGLAKRAGKATSGTDAVIARIKSHEAHLVVISEDASSGTKKRISDKCKSYSTDYIFYGNCDDIGRAIGVDNCVAVAITDEGFAQAIKNKYSNLTEVAENGSC